MGVGTAVVSGSTLRGGGVGAAGGCGEELLLDGRRYCAPRPRPLSPEGDGASGSAPPLCCCCCVVFSSFVAAVALPFCCCTFVWEEVVCSTVVGFFFTPDDDGLLLRVGVGAEARLPFFGRGAVG